MKSERQLRRKMRVSWRDAPLPRHWNNHHPGCHLPSHSSLVPDGCGYRLQALNTAPVAGTTDERAKRVVKAVIEWPGDQDSDSSIEEVDIKLLKIQERLRGHHNYLMEATTKEERKARWNADISGSRDLM